MLFIVEKPAPGTGGDEYSWEPVQIVEDDTIDDAIERFAKDMVSVREQPDGRILFQMLEVGPSQYSQYEQRSIRPASKRDVKRVLKRHLGIE